MISTSRHQTLCELRLQFVTNIIIGKARYRKLAAIFLSLLGPLLVLGATNPARAQQEVGLYNYLGHDAHVPGGRLAGESWSDIHLHNYNAAIRVLQKAAPLGNEDAMDCLAYCYFFGNGVPVDRIKAA
jgi:TPR repeat protein